MHPIFITGSNGFVGSHCPLAIGLEGDLRDYSHVKRQIEKANPAAVIHLAAQSNIAYSVDNPRETYEVNFLGTFNLLEALKSSGFKGRFLYVSSAYVYGAFEGNPWKESDPCYPLNPYAVSKLSAEMLCLQEKAVDIMIARPFNHIGPGQGVQNAIPAFARQLAAIKRGEQLPTLLVGNLETTRDFCDVRDVVRGYLLLLEKGRKGEIYNLCSGKEYRMRDVLEKLVAISGQVVELVEDAKLTRSGEKTRMVGSYNKIYELGWQPEISLEQSLRDIWESI